MLARVGELANRHGSLGVHRVAASAGDGRRTRRRDVVGFIDDEHVEGEPLTQLGVLGLGIDVAQQALAAHLRQPRHGHDHPWIQLKRIGVQAVGTVHLGHQFTVDDDELQAEFVPHLVLPLQRQAWRAHDHCGAGTMPQEQFLHDQAGLDGLAQSNVIGQQQVGPRAGQRPTQWFELVCLDGDPRPERCLVAVRIRRGDRAPAHRVDEAGQGDGIIKALWVDVLGQSLRWGDGLADL
ncbi:Uncharacterised protein [Mycobacteroides abscessus subsp. abscessus]|nr:Uncharacterised protein [Mycobacteroides abscessus subsp. abscessus]